VKVAPPKGRRQARLGVFDLHANTKWRRDVVDFSRPPLERPSSATTPKKVGASHNRIWAELIGRGLDIDVLECPPCRDASSGSSSLSRPVDSGRPEASAACRCLEETPQPVACGSIGDDEPHRCGSGANRRTELTEQRSSERLASSRRCRCRSLPAAAGTPGATS